MIDTHCHLDAVVFDHDRDKVINLARESGVDVLINIGCSLERSKKAIDIAKHYSFIYPTVGIHPNQYDELNDIAWQKLLEIVDIHHNDIVGFGETGLDYYYLEKLLEQEAKRLKVAQSDIFRKHLELSLIYKKPVVIHSRDAASDTVDMLLNTDFHKAVVHCFSESYDVAQDILSLDNTMLSFTGNITYSRSKNLRETIQRIPLERIMIETDSPYLTPVPHRGKRNEPQYTIYIAETIAQLKNIKLDECISILDKNSYLFWNI